MVILYDYTKLSKKLNSHIVIKTAVAAKETKIML